MSTQRIQRTAPVNAIIKAFAEAWQYYAPKRGAPVPAYEEAETVFLNCFYTLTETDESLPRGKVPAIKTLRESCALRSVTVFHCENAEFAQCFPLESRNNLRAIKLETGRPTCLGLLEAKQIIEAFENALQPEIFKQREL